MIELVRARLDRGAERSAERHAREIAYVGLFLAVVAAAVFGSYVRDGGWNDDDWVWLNEFHPAFSGHSLHLLRLFLTYRPAADLYVYPVFTLLAHHMTIALAVTLALYVSEPIAFYVVLRTLDFDRIPASALALLALLFPFANVSAFWPTAGVISIATTCFLVGLTLSLRALDSGSRSQHLLALAFWVISFLTYEIASVPMIAAGLLYLRRAPRARALRHWAVDAAVLIPLFVLEALFKSRLQASSDTTILASFSTATSHVKALVTETFSLLGPVAFPFRMSTAALQNANAQSTIHRPMGLWPLLALAVVAVALFVRRRARPEVAAELTRWLGIAAGSVVALVAAYLVFVPASSGYTPLQQGINNRTNAVAAFAWVPLLYSVFMLAGICLSAGLTRRSSLSSVFVLCACAVVAVGYVRFDLADKQHWSRAYEAEVATLDGIRAAVPSASADSTFYVLVRRTETAPGVRIFVARADLAGALAYRYGKYGIAALPVARSIGSFTCSRRTMKFNAPEDLSIPATPYRHVIAVNGLGDAFRRVPIRGAADCRRFGAALALPSLNG